MNITKDNMSSNDWVTIDNRKKKTSKNWSGHAKSHKENNATSVWKSNEKKSVLPIVSLATYPPQPLQNTPNSETSKKPEKSTKPPNSETSKKPEKSTKSPNSETSKKPEKTQISTYHRVDDTWVLWFHDMKETNWGLESYEKLFEFDTIEDFWILYNSINDLNNGMYYLMRKGVPPIWDHEKNINGGAWTFKVDKRNLNRFWEDLSCYCVGETICPDSHNIVGLSISPKIRFATLRVWTKNNKQDASQFELVATETRNNSIVIDFKEARFTLNQQALT